MSSILAVGNEIKRLTDGQVLRVRATDIGFATDIGPWCESTGNELLGVEKDNGHFIALIRKGRAVDASAGPSAAAGTAESNGRTIVVFSGDLDKVLAAFVIANGAASMGGEVTMFFTFWGLNALRKDHPPVVKKGLMDRMFGWMMPRGVRKLKLSKMNMAGLGTSMMKGVMASKNVDSLEVLMDKARQAGVKLVACAMSMDVMGLQREELIDGIEVGGVGMYLGAAGKSNVNLFI